MAKTPAGGMSTEAIRNCLSPILIGIQNESQTIIDDVLERLVEGVVSMSAEHVLEGGCGNDAVVLIAENFEQMLVEPAQIQGRPSKRRSGDDLPGCQSLNVNAFFELTTHPVVKRGKINVSSIASQRGARHGKWSQNFCVDERFK